MDSTKPVITKETKNKISVDYEGKLTFKERLQKKLKKHTHFTPALPSLRIFSQ